MRFQKDFFHGAKINKLSLPLNHKPLNLTKEDIQEYLRNQSKADILQEGRNFIFISTLENGEKVVVKSFKKPNAFNRLVYCFFRKSKARRSYEYAEKLTALGIGTPHPIGYLEIKEKGCLSASYYVSEYQPYDLTYRELVVDVQYPDWENILRQFTRFSFSLHEKGVQFKDHSPGNTLIEKTNPSEYAFYLVDLNRMNFHGKLTFRQRMYNMRRLTPRKEMVEIMSDEYAKMSGEPYDKVFDMMWEETLEFQRKYHRKQAWKRRWKALINS